MQFKLPELGEGVHEGELVKWKVALGDSVKYDQSLCEIMTDKATVEIPSAFQGKVAEFNAKEGEIVHVGQVLLTFEGAAAATGASPATGAAGAQSAEKPAPAPQAAAPSAAGPKAPAAPQAQAPAQAMQAAPAAVANLDPSSRALASPATRRAAREMGVDLNRITGSGEHGRILRDDLARAGGTGAAAAGAPSYATGGLAAKGAPAKAPAAKLVPQGGEERIRFGGLRKKIAEKMRQSKDHAAHFTYVEEADATELVALRAQAKELGAAQGIKVTYLPFVMKAMVAALKQYPILNSSLDEEKQEIVLKHYYNIGLSVQTDDGLTAPVVKDVGNKSIWEIAREIQTLVDKARAKKLTMEDLTGGSVTLTNAGSIGGLFATPVINYPEVAILGFNKIFRKPVAKVIGGKEEIVVRDWTYFSISLDHRIVDGAIGAEFMKTFIRYIETPSLLILEG
jgi:pyruvate dehydrogenase E2 component (dihydrolipoamide acetyltransferase)